MEMENLQNLISLQKLARLEDPLNFNKAYERIRARAKRGKYTSYVKIKGEGFVSISDPGIPIQLQNIVRNSEVNTCSDVLKVNKEELEFENELSDKQNKIALARADVISKYLALTQNSPYKTLEAKTKFINAYNNAAFPDLHNITGPLNFKTVERWKQIYLSNKRDYRVLAPQYKSRKSSGVTPEQSSILIRLFLSPNKPLISEVIRYALDIFEAKRLPHIRSEATYRRFLESWKKEHYADYVFYREGEKALDDKVLPYLERDFSLIEVGDIIVADGHVLNFDIINPFTGKPKRMMLVLFLDMKSNMPLGWEISPTENTFAISIALRRSILRLGKFPKVIYLDNGRAFSSKFFNGMDFDSSGIKGLFERIGAKVITAIPYHAQSKTIERFFSTFSELERLIPTYTGTSIELKPPRMNRGEKLHNNLYNKFMSGSSIDIFKAHQAIAWWFDVYAERKQQEGHLKGLRPIDLFEKGKGPGVDKKELMHLMMSQEIKTIYRNGIRMFNTSFWHETLFGRKLDEVLVRFDILENESIFVYDKSGEFLCEARRIDKVHPAAGILGSEEDVKLLHDQLERKNSLKKLVVGDAKKFLQDEIYPTAKRQFENNIITLKSDSQLNEGIASPQPSARKRKSLTDSWKMPENGTAKNIDLISKVSGE